MPKTSLETTHGDLVSVDPSSVPCLSGDKTTELAPLAGDPLVG